MRKLNRRERRAIAQARAAQTVSSAASPRPRGSNDMLAFMQRYPRPSLLASSMTVLSILLGNGYLLWQVHAGELRTAGIILVVMAEMLLLGVLAHIQLSRVPAQHRPKLEHDDRATPLSMLFAFAVFSGAYAMWMFILGELPLLWSYLHDPGFWLHSGVAIALGITLVFSLIGAVGDEQHYRQHGPPYVSSLAIESSGRRILFAYGAIMIALPLMLVLFSVLGVLRWLSARHGVEQLGDRRVVIAALLGLGLLFGTFYLLAWTVDSGSLGWAGVYLLNKVIAESCFALLPLLARRGERATTATVGA